MRAFRILTAIFAILAAASALAQAPVTVNITGNLTQIAGSPQPYGGLNIQLQNCPSPVTITGYSAIVQQTLQLRADGSGVINASIWPNDEIDCNGTTGQSMYALVPIVNGVPSQTPQCYQVAAAQGIWNLNTQQPIACTQTPPSPQDAQYQNLNVLGCLSIHGGACSTTSGSGGGGPGVTRILAGSNVTVTPSGGTGDVTVNVAGSGSMVYPGAGVPVSTGSAWGISKAIQGTDTNLLSAGTVSSTPGLAICSDALGGATTTGCPNISNILNTAANPGFVYQIGTSGNPSTRPAVAADVATLLGYTPLSPANDLGDVTNALDALNILFTHSGLQSSQLLGTSSAGGPSPVLIGPGLSYSTSGVTGSVVGLVLNAAGLYHGCPTISFSGGGGTGATATASCRVAYCSGISGCNYYLTLATVTSGGSGYVTAPTVVLTGSGSGGDFTAVIASAATVDTSTLIPQVGTPTAGHAACIKSTSPIVVIGYCSTQPDAGGACTCN